MQKTKLEEDFEIHQGAYINKNNRELQSYKTVRNRILNPAGNEINTLKEEVEILKTDINDIKSDLKLILEALRK